MLEFPASLDAVPQLGLASLLPAPKTPENSKVEEQHDGTGDEEGADGGVHHIVIILQLAFAGVAWGDIIGIIDAKHDG